LAFEIINTWRKPNKICTVNIAGKYFFSKKNTRLSLNVFMKFLEARMQAKSRLTLTVRADVNNHFSHSL
jgi:hypothetical protein